MNLNQISLGRKMTTQQHCADHYCLKSYQMCTVQLVTNIMKVQGTPVNSVVRMTKNMLKLHWLIIITVALYYYSNQTKGIRELVWPN